jgi:hypothetical protein
MASNSEKTEKDKPSEKPAKISSQPERKEKDKPKHEGDSEGPSKF